MFLSIDVGNTNITLGLYDGDRLMSKTRMLTITPRSLDECGQELSDFVERSGGNLSGAGIFSVVPWATPPLAGGVKKYLETEPFLLKKGIETGIDFGCYKNGELGADRLVDAAAAYSKYNGAVLVIDFGTATTYDVVASDGKYLGGAIAPGIKISAEALWEKTAKLPEVKIEKPLGIFGKNTVGSMQSGIFFGYVGQVEYMVRKMKAAAGENLKVVATGGFSALFRGCTDAIDVYDEDLTLWGIKHLYDINCKANELKPILT